MTSAASRILAPALYCPTCAQVLVTHEDFLGCDACRHTWPLREQVASFCDLAPAWGGDSGEQAAALFRRAEERGWDEAVHDQFPRENITEYWRMYGPACADWFHLGHVECREVAVCLGVGWGALPMRLASLFSRVIAADWVWDRVKFARELLAREAVRNVTLIHANLGALPLPPENCDLVVLNGGLEWAAFHEKEADPEAAQWKVLSRVRRLLRPGGSLCLGASNRFSAERLMGRRDHGRPPWAGVVPRPLSRLYRVVGREPARHALSHSLGGYRRLLAAAGFTEVQGYAAFPSHHYPRMLVEAGGATLAWAARLSLARRGRRLGPGARLVHSLASSSTFARAGCLLCDSLIIWARRPLAPLPKAGGPSHAGKGGAYRASMMRALKARLVAEWQELGLEGAAPASLSVVQFSGNWDRGGKVNWFLFPDQAAEPAVVAKVARTPGDTGRMEHEHRTLLWLRSLKPEVSQHIPRPLARWEINGHLVTLQQYRSWPPLTKQISALPPKAAVRHALVVMTPFLTELALAVRAEWPHGNPYLSELIRNARQMANGRSYNATTRALLEALARLAEEAADLPFAVPHHGDTSTADILMAESAWGKAATAQDFHVLDWEWSVREGVPLIDLVSLGLSAAWRHDAQTVVETIRALALLPPATGEGQPELDDVVNDYCDALGMPRAWRRPMVAATLLNAMLRMPQSRISHLIISWPDESDEIIVAARALLAGEPGAKGVPAAPSTPRAAGAK